MCRESQMGVAAAQRALERCVHGARRLRPRAVGRRLRFRLHAHGPRRILGADAMPAPDDQAFDFSRWASTGHAAAFAAVAAEVSAEHARQPHRDLQRFARAEQFTHLARGGVEPGGRRGFSRHPARPCRRDGRRRHRHARPSDEGPARRNARRNRSQWPGPPAGQPAVRSESHWHGSGRRRGRDRVEELESAKSRGAKIYAEIVGAGARRSSIESASHAAIKH